MAQGKDHIWGGIPLEAALDESMLDDDLGRYLGITQISLKKQEDIERKWLMSSLEIQQEKGYLDFGCLICSRKLFWKCIYVLFVVLILVGLVATIVILFPKHHSVAESPDDFTLALQKALLFFDAQKSGVLPDNYIVPYRKSSGLQDGIIVSTNTSVDLKGGFYDSGNNIKFGFPAAYATTLLSWSVIEYSAKYKATGELDHVKAIISWSTDYLLKTFNYSDPVVKQIYAQVREGSISDPPKENDGYCWQRPEDMDYPRMIATCTSAPELAAETAAALAAASIVFKIDKPDYSKTLIQAAQTIFRFATDPGKTISYTASGAADAASFYPSSGFADEHIWASAWLFFATGNWTYFNIATDANLMQIAQNDSSNPDSYGIFDWDHKLMGAQMLLTRLLILMDPGVAALSNSHDYINTLMCLYLPQSQHFEVTKGGLFLLKGVNTTAPLHYTVTAAFLAALYADYMQAADIPGWSCNNSFFLLQTLRNFSISQVEYILGANPAGESYVVGYGSKYAEFVHHRAASIPNDGKKHGCQQGFVWRDSRTPNPNKLEGAMVGGPNARDTFNDSRANSNSTEPTIASNAGLSAALVALSSASSSSSRSLSSLIDVSTLFSLLPPLFNISNP